MSAWSRLAPEGAATTSAAIAAHSKTAPALRSRRFRSFISLSFLRRYQGDGRRRTSEPGSGGSGDATPQVLTLTRSWSEDDHPVSYASMLPPTALQHTKRLRSRGLQP